LCPVSVPSDGQTVAKELDAAKKSIEAKVGRSFFIRAFRVAQLAALLRTWFSWSSPLLVSPPVLLAQHRDGCAAATDCMASQSSSQSLQLTAGPAGLTND